MPAGKWSASVFRANFDRRQGLTDVNQIGFTGAIGIADRFELFGSWRLVRIDRDVKPVFVPGDPGFGGVSHETPFVDRAGPETWLDRCILGGKWALHSAGPRRRDEPRAARDGEVPGRRDAGEHRRLGSPHRARWQPRVRTHGSK